jgi:hypothetical protein
MEHDRYAVPLHGNCHVLQAPVRGRRKFGEKETDTRKVEFPEPAGVRKVGADFPAIDHALDNEAVGAGYEGGANDVLEKLHAVIVTDPGGVVIRSRKVINGKRRDDRDRRLKSTNGFRHFSHDRVSPVGVYLLALSVNLFIILQ